VKSYGKKRTTPSQDKERGKGAEKSIKSASERSQVLFFLPL